MIKTMQTRSFFAVALCWALVLTGIWSFTFPLAASQNSGPQQNESLKGPQFQENRLWELRMKDLSRSADEISVLSPQIGARVKGKKIRFEWKRAQNSPVFLRLINNRNKEICTREIKGRTFELEAKDLKMKPGLFYWVIETEMEMLFVGKFFYLP